MLTRRDLLLAVPALALAGCSSRSTNRVAVSCAQDREFAEGLFARFERDTGIAIDAKFDTEAQKSVGLARELEAEARNPRIDLFWNNEPINTIRLQRAGILEPYSSPFAEPFPGWTRPADHTWQAFAARARVLIVNTTLIANPADRPTSILDLTKPAWKGKTAIAKPFFGTTATHMACLTAALGTPAVETLFRQLRDNAVQIVPGNKQVATGVAEGRFAFGLTDTDDALIEEKAGKPVTMLFPDTAGHPEWAALGTLYLPNTLALIRNAPRPAPARQLFDFLIQSEPELAEGGGYQIPLNPKVTAKLPERIKRPDQVKRMDVDFAKAADVWDETQALLRKHFG